MTAEVDEWLAQHRPKLTVPERPEGSCLLGRCRCRVFSCDLIWQRVSISGCCACRCVVAEGYRLDWDGLGVVEGVAAADGTGAIASTSPAAGGSGGVPWTWNDVRLHRAAELARSARQAVFDKLQYTCTAGRLCSAPKRGDRASSHPVGGTLVAIDAVVAGVAHNKTLAKLGSSRRKPNQQVRRCYPNVKGIVPLLKASWDYLPCLAT